MEVSYVGMVYGFFEMVSGFFGMVYGFFEMVHGFYLERILEGCSLSGCVQPGWLTSEADF
jgi:hypothetical protein